MTLTIPATQVTRRLAVWAGKSINGGFSCGLIVTSNETLPDFAAGLWFHTRPEIGKRFDWVWKDE